MAVEPRTEWAARARAGLAAVSLFALCASCAWLAALTFELTDMNTTLRRIPARLGYLAEVALACSALWLPVLGLLHLLRRLLKSRVRYADVLLCMLLAAALALPSQRRAQLLTGGTGMLDVAGELPLQIAITAALVAGYLVVWVLHLALCRPPADNPLEQHAGQRHWGRLLRGLGYLLLAAAVVGFAFAVDEALRAYAFLVAFAMPAAWLLGASLWYALIIRSPRQPVWTTLSVAFVFGAAAYGFEHPTPVRHAKAELIRRAGLAAQSEAARHFAPPPKYASLSLGPKRRYRCKPRSVQPGPTALRLAPEKRRNVILISIDALRRDAIGPRRERPSITPSLDAFAKRSVRFDRAITPYPATLFALGGVLTGLYPSELLLAPPTLPDVLQLTAASWDERIAIWPDVVWFRRSALPRMITRSLDPTLLPGAERQTDRFIHELKSARAAGQRTFAWLHYYEPHQTLARDAPVQGTRPRERYEGLVKIVDQQIGRLLQELEKLGYLEDSLIAVFGDHGEALGELGYYGHHVYLNHFIGDIPLIVYAPELAAGASDQLASITDLAPTILEWTGTAGLELASDSRSLFRLARSTEERYGLSEAFPVRGRLLYELVREPIASLAALRERLSLVRSGSVDYQPKVALVSSRYRLLVNRVTGDEEFYDRADDRTEQHDLAERNLPEQRRMRDALKATMQRMSERIYCRVAALPSSPAPGVR